MRQLSKIHVFGASGAGTTTLAKHLADKLDLPHFDADNYFWQPTDPPYQQKTGRSLRIQALGKDLGASDHGWVLSGCVASWGESLLTDIDLSVFVYLDEKTRIDRLRSREREEFGQRIEPGGDMYANHLDFIAWARSYDSAHPPIRSLALHEQWITNSVAPTIRVNSKHDISSLVQDVLQLPPNK